MRYIRVRVSEDCSVLNSTTLSNSVELAGRLWLTPFRNHRNKNYDSTTRVLRKRHFDSIPLQLTAKIMSRMNERTKMKVVEKKGVKNLKIKIWSEAKVEASTKPLPDYFLNASRLTKDAKGSFFYTHCR